MQRATSAVAAIDIVEFASRLVAAADEVLTRAVVHAREIGRTWTEIADALALTKDQAQQRYAGAIDRWQDTLAQPWQTNGSVLVSRLPAGAREPDHTAHHLDHWCQQHLPPTSAARQTAHREGTIKRMVSAHLPTRLAGLPPTATQPDPTGSTTLAKGGPLVTEPSSTPTNGKLVEAVRDRIITAINKDGAVPGRRTLAADLGVTEYHIRQAMTQLDHPAPTSAADTTSGRPRAPRWPLLLLALPAFVSIWGGWVGLGRLTGFGPIHLLPGIWDNLQIDSAITLPIGLETYAAYALSIWLTGDIADEGARQFAKISALTALGVGAAGQIAYHLMTAYGVTTAPGPSPPWSPRCRSPCSAWAPLSPTSSPEPARQAPTLAQQTPARKT